MVLAAVPAGTLAQRAEGIDVSQWQSNSEGDINWTRVRNEGNKVFAFIRSSRGGTTTALGLYTDPYFYTNIKGAYAAGILAGPYHFARPDLNTSTGGGTDNAQSFLNAAGMFMRPGFLRPVLDLEDGDVETQPAGLANWAVAFADKIYAAKGVYPIIYTNSNYAKNEIGSGVLPKLQDLWLARPAGSVDPQTGQPPTPSGYPNPYGQWAGVTPPWKFWQYYIPPAAPSSYIAVPGIPLRVDLDVANGDIEFVKDFLVPAMLVSDTSVDWSTIATWNINAISIPAKGVDIPARTPEGDDTVILDRPSANPTITLSSGVHSIRRLTNKETLSLAGGTLSVSKTATVSGPTNLSGSAALNVTESLSVTAGATLAQTGGTLTLGNASTRAAFTNSGTFTKSAGVLVMNSSSAAGATFSNSGVATIGGAQAWGPGSTFSNAGTATFNSDAGSAASYTLSVSANSSAGVTFNTSQHLAGLSVGPSGRATVAAGGSRLLVTKSLTIDSIGRLDLSDNDGIVDYTGTSPATTLRVRLQSARTSSGTWTGNGLLSTSAASDAQKRTAIGWAEASDLLGLTGLQTATWAGQTVDATTLVFKYTWYGDANLDGLIAMDDYVRIDRGMAMGLTGWINGDFDYSGSITIADYALIDRVFVQQSGALSPELLAEREARFGSDYVATLVASVPEPSLAAAGALALPLLLSSRRCRRGRTG